MSKVTYEKKRGTDKKHPTTLVWHGRYNIGYFINNQHVCSDYYAVSKKWSFVPQSALNHDYLHGYTQKALKVKIETMLKNKKKEPTKYTSTHTKKPIKE